MAEPIRVFLSYRREDTRHVAGRLADRLTDRFRLFMDIDTIEPGMDFTDAVRRAIDECDVLLAFIGTSWTDVVDEGGRRRLEDPNDWVVEEIRAALQRGIPVIPVLVDGARIPDRSELPAALAALANRQAVTLRHESFTADSSRLMTAIERIVAHAAEVKPRQSTASEATRPQSSQDESVHPSLRDEESIRDARLVSATLGRSGPIATPRTTKVVAAAVSLAILVVAGVLVFNHYRNQGISAEPPGTPVSSHPPISPTPSRSVQTKPIVVGSANFTESEVLANLYADALKAKGITVSTKMDIGSREVYLKALKDNSISLVPEYTGNLLLSFGGNSKAKSVGQIYQALPAVLGSNLKVLKPSAATDQGVYVVTRRYSQENGITSLADVKKVSGKAVLGASSSVRYSDFGPLGVQRIYGASFKGFKPYESTAAKAQALNDNVIQFATLFTTESEISANGYVELKDPKSMILPQNVVPLIRADAAEDAVATAALEAVQAALTTADLRAMDKSVDVDHQSATRVAAEWLKSKNLA